MAMLLIDVVNDMNFEGSQALPMARALRKLKRRAARQGAPVIYVNDNFGRWKSDFRRIVEHCTNEKSGGAEASRLLRPGPDDYFVLKTMHSGFTRELSTLCSRA
jgi:nicotinamidase-related amidase